MNKAIPRIEPATLLKHFEYLMGAAKIGVDIIDSRFNIRYIDPAWAKAYGDPSGKKCYQYFMGKTAVCPGCGVARAFKTKKKAVTEERLAREGNRPIEVTTIPFRDENGDWLVAETNVDISRMKKAEEELAHLNSLLLSTIESTFNGILVVDHNGNITRFNRKFAEMWRIPRSVLAAHDDKKALAYVRGQLKDPAAFLRKVRELYNKPERESYDVLEFKDGRFFERYSRPQRIGREIVGRVWTFHDITERRKAEAILKRDRRELERIVGERSRDLLMAQEALGKAKHLSDLGLLAATVAHDLRTPLAAIRTAAYNIDNKCTSTAIDTHIETIEKKVLEADHIIKNLLAYSRIKAPMYEDVDLCMVLDECIGLSREIFRGHNVTIRRVMGCVQPFVIQADPVQLREVFSNVLNNAYECFSGKRGAVAVRIRRQNGYCKVSIHDNGPGIPADDLKRILEPFFTTKSAGVGLGLTVCRQIIDLHNGKLDISSQRGKGTTITITLPVRHAGGPSRQ